MYRYKEKQNLHILYRGVNHAYTIIYGNKDCMCNYTEKQNLNAQIYREAKLKFNKYTEKQKKLHLQLNREAALVCTTIKMHVLYREAKFACATIREAKLAGTTIQR